MDTVIEADALADRLDEVRVVDVREAWEFEAMGHLPGAVNIPFDSFRADAHAAGGAADGDGGADAPGATAGVDAGGDTATEDRRGMLPGADVFAELLGEAGITREDDIVAYDDHHGVFAARLLVTAEMYGHPFERLHLLDGDFSSWRLDHGTDSDAPGLEPATYEVVEPESTPLVGIEEVAAAVDAGTDTVVVDTREAWEYAEGHIPGAVRLDWRELVDDETRGILPREELEAVLSERGITPDRRVVLYCNTARRISHTYVVLRHLGYPDLAFYEGSLTEWEAAGRALETGAGD